ncbi:hypothetical protein [Staphylococcus equorum]|uniref:hypothetical protein n=1 Tax=Staphylococcus equorum TaxID=246432 RepID=UPI003D802C60
MFIAQANFTASLEDRAILDNKISHAKDDFSGYDGLIDVEIWKNETKSKISYSIVSKWNEKRISKHGCHVQHMLKNIKICARKKKKILNLQVLKNK